MTSQNEQKRRAAHRAVERIESGMVLGLGTGSTTRFALLRIGELARAGRLTGIVGIPSSVQTERLAREQGIPLAGLDTHASVDLTIDGADEVDQALDLIKGGGGALLREKVLAQASRENIIIVDESKISPRLGTRWAVPVEVVPFAWKAEEGFLASLGAEASLRRDASGDPVCTDQGNWVLDARFGPIEDSPALARELEGRAGIAEHGLFIGLATEVVVAGAGDIRVLSRGG